MAPRGTWQRLAFSSAAQSAVSLTPAESWEHALACGNGASGCLVFGQPAADRLVLSRAGLFMPMDAPVPPVPTAPHLPQLRGLLAQGRYRDAAAYVIDLDAQHDQSGSRWTDPLIPACELRLHTSLSGEPRRYARGVDFSTGAVAVGFDDDRGSHRRRVFASRPRDLVVLQATASGAGGLDAQLALCRPSHPDEHSERAARDGIERVEVRARDGLLSYRSTFRRPWPGSLRGHAVVARVVTRGGALGQDGDGLRVRGASELLVIARILLQPSSDALDLEAALAELAHVELDFERLLAEHTRDHRALFDRVRLDLGGTDHELPTEELLARASPDRLDPTLVQKQFDAARCLLVSSSRELPPTLQGIWSGTHAPPWSSDYTHDGNAPTAVAANLTCNLAECLLPYLEYHFARRADYRVNAERLYGCRGILVPSRSSSHGLNNHFNLTWPMTFWTAGAGWVAHYFYEYWRYTGDAAFLRDRAVPFMRDAAAFYEDFLFEGPHGKLMFSPSYSPENEPLGGDSQACVNATMDLAVARELFTHLVQAAQVVPIDAEALARYRTLLDKLPDYRINADGALAEWLLPELEDNHEHRHVSHLYALFDGMPDHIAASPRLRAAFRRAIERRLEIRRREAGGVMAFGLAQLGLAAAALGEAQLTAEVLGWLSSKYWRSSLTTTHDPGALFNVDLCGGFPALVARALVDSRPGHIELLKALPPAFASGGSIAGLRCRGQVTVQRLSWSPDELNVQLRSELAQQLALTLPARFDTATVTPDGAARSVTPATVTLVLQPNQSVAVSARRRR